MDRYGFTSNHQFFTLELEDNYTDTLPADRQNVALAMSLCEAWSMPWPEILAMDYGEFQEAIAIHKAVTYKRPWWRGAIGEQAYHMERAGNKRLPKPKRNNHHNGQ